MTLSDYAHTFWLLSCQARQRLPYYQLSREDRVKVCFPWNLRKELLDALLVMPPHLAERVIVESKGW